MTRGPYEPERVRQLRILLLLVLGVAVFLLGWAGMILAGNGSTENALRVLIVPGLLLGLLAAGALRALAADRGTARVWVAASGAVTLVVALLLSRTFAGLLIAVIGVPLLLIGVLPGRDEGPQRPGG